MFSNIVPSALSQPAILFMTSEAARPLPSRRARARLAIKPNRTPRVMREPIHDHA
jgi:hypothetical protein